MTTILAPRITLPAAAIFGVAFATAMFCGATWRLSSLLALSLGNGLGTALWIRSSPAFDDQLDKPEQDPWSPLKMAGIRAPVSHERRTSEWPRGGPR